MRSTALIVDDLDVGQRRHDPRPERLKKSLLTGKTRGVGGCTVNIFRVAIILLDGRKNAVAEMFFLDGAPHPIDFYNIGSDAQNHFATKSVSDC